MLSDFYKDLQAWIDTGFPENPLFNPSRAMCVSYRYWLESKGYESSTAPLINQFMEANLDAVYPFNPKDDFWIELNCDTVWENKARLQWVRQHAS